jgi:hypothetical protein
LLAMPSRVIAFFLAVVLFWSGISIIEAPRALAQPSEQQHTIADAGGTAATTEGSVEHHHLDDLPSQARNDSPPETRGLLPAALPPGFPGLRSVPSCGIGIPSWGLTVSPQACQRRCSDTVKSTVRTPGTGLDRKGRLRTLGPRPYGEIGLFWDGRKHRGTSLAHSHSMVAGGLLLTS